MNEQELQKGQYKVPEGCVASIRQGVISIRENKKQVISGKRCRDCKYFGHGQAVYKGHDTTVCHKHPKPIKGNKIPKDTQLFYHVGGTHFTCDLFEDKK